MRSQREGEKLAAAPDKRILGDAALRNAVESFSKRRVELVQRAVKEWTSALIDLGGRNNLLHYRDLKSGTLDLTEANSSAVAALLRGKTIKVSSLSGDPEERERILRRSRTIHNKSKENFEERGLETLSLACGLATWENKRASWEPCAPVLLRQATIRPLGAARDEFELALVDEMEVNPTLLHLLKVDFDCEINPEKLLDRVDGVIDETWELEKTYEWIVEQTQRVPGFGVKPRIVLANFAYAKLPMVNDLENAFDKLVAHELIAAIAGDEKAKETIQAAGTGPDAILNPDSTPLADEFLVLDADSSQRYAINAVLAGGNLIIKGPPGTGKSQTIANLIGSLIARNKRVLFVAEKRAAINAVLKRLNEKKLGDLVLDLHGGVGSRRAFARTIKLALETSRNAAKVDNAVALGKVEKRRAELNALVAALHIPREPWGKSAYELWAELLGLNDAKNEIRFRGDALDRLDIGTAVQIEEDLSEFARLGGMTLALSGSPWAQSPIISSEEVQTAHAGVDELRRHTLPTTLSALRSASETTALPLAETIEAWEPRLALWQDVHETLALYQTSIYDEDLDELCTQLAPAADSGFARLKGSLFSTDYKTARRRVRSRRLDQLKCSDRDLLRQCEAARDQRRRWQELGGTSIPVAPDDPRSLLSSYAHLLGQLGQLENWTGLEGLATRPTLGLERLLTDLLADQGTLITLPELHQLETSLAAVGLVEFLAEMKARQVSEEFVIRGFRYSWLQSILDHVSLSDKVIGGFAPDKHEKAIEDFKNGDRRHIETTAARIRRGVAEQAIKVRDTNRDQEEIVKHQAGLKRRHVPVRDLISNAADVLLALKPCWAMSPLAVSQLLPPKTYFDVVIFDEASQITPADAVTSILRGTQLVIAGDERQLPPTSFFVSGNPEDEDEEQDDAGAAPIPIVAGTKGFESILDAIGPLLSFRMLRWHYRSRDERLIAFSNAHIYDRQLTTFPGAGGDDVLRFVQAPWEPSADTNSPSPEVDAAADLIIEHARIRPHESLGVIAMGIRHANRIEECLRQRMHGDRALEDELSDFLAEDKEEKFFIKNLERVQGDERDAIILSIGYGKDAKGSLPLRWGPILEEGGERRLNVAVTRAKNRITLLSSFSTRDIDSERSNREGFQFIRQYLQYIESGGENLGDRVLEKPELNPFEVDVRDTLQRSGLKLIAQYGSSGYWIDFAVQHPTHPGRFVLAIECDGATYHSSESARDRDRLRQEQLERLGWRFCRIWSSEWFHNKERAVEKVLAAYELAVQVADKEDEEEMEAAKRLRSEGRSDDSDAQLIAKPKEVLHGEEPSTRRNGPRPPLRRGRPITEYSRTGLVRLVRWIESDDLLRTEGELLEETMRELGFKRHGSRVVAAITQAIQEARR
jgi:very-short-patch-repair endonuclease/DNA polymerase III delta prime subunit